MVLDTDAILGGQLVFNCYTEETLIEGNNKIKRSSGNIFSEESIY